MLYDPFAGYCKLQLERFLHLSLIIKIELQGMKLLTS
jgi:hypothetical protein